jgi:hypothetical protein
MKTANASLSLAAALAIALCPALSFAQVQTLSYRDTIVSQYGLLTGAVLRCGIATREQIADVVGRALTLHGVTAQRDLNDVASIMVRVNRTARGCSGKRDYEAFWKKVVRETNDEWAKRR